MRESSIVNFKRGVVFFSILGITGTQESLSVGVYQTLSQAITVNHYEKQYPYSIGIRSTFNRFGFGISGIYDSAFLSSLNNYMSHNNFGIVIPKNKNLESIHFHENYDKQDFSQFDN